MARYSLECPTSSNREKNRGKTMLTTSRAIYDPCRHGRLRIHNRPNHHSQALQSGYRQHQPGRRGQRSPLQLWRCASPSPISTSPTSRPPTVSVPHSHYSAVCLGAWPTGTGDAGQLRVARSCSRQRRQADLPRRPQAIGERRHADARQYRPRLVRFGPDVVGAPDRPDFLVTGSSGAVQRRLGIPLPLL